MTDQPAGHHRARKLYPFTEHLPVRGQTSNGSSITPSIDWRVTTYKPNPFHGIDRWVFAVDEWQHSVGGRLPSLQSQAWTWTWRPFCGWWDRRLLGSGDAGD